jgi:C4-dicarboxylate transporter DctQ subunit
MKVLDRLEEYLIALLMASATIITVLAVLHRYFSGIAIPYVQDALIAINVSWAQELTIYLFVWMAKFGAAYGVRSGIHVGVDVLVNRMSLEKQKIFVLISLGSGALFTGIIGTLGANFVYHMAMTEQTSADLEIPMWWVYLAIPLGSYLMCFRFLQVAWNFVRTGEVPKHDHTHVEGIDKEVQL